MAQLSPFTVAALILEEENALEVLPASVRENLRDLARAYRNGPKILKPDDVEEPGFYWFRGKAPFTDNDVHRIVRVKFDCDGDLIFSPEPKTAQMVEHTEGEFYGPLLSPFEEEE